MVAEHTVKAFDGDIKQRRGLIAEMGGLAEVALRQGRLDEARAQLDKADLSESNLRGAWFYLASAIEARFVKADLQDAVMVSTNLMNAILQRSNIVGADMRLSNLFQADFARVRVSRRPPAEAFTLADGRLAASSHRTSTSSGRSPRGTVPTSRIDRLPPGRRSKPSMKASMTTG